MPTVGEKKTGSRKEKQSPPTQLEGLYVSFWMARVNVLRFTSC